MPWQAFAAIDNVVFKISSPIPTRILQLPYYDCIEVIAYYNIHNDIVILRQEPGPATCQRMYWP